MRAVHRVVPCAAALVAGGGRCRRRARHEGVGSVVVGACCSTGRVRAVCLRCGVQPTALLLYARMSLSLTNAPPISTFDVTPTAGLVGPVMFQTEQGLVGPVLGRS